MSRELIMSKEYFLDEISYDSNIVKEWESENINDVKYPHMLFYDIFMKHYELLFLLYSGGLEISLINKQITIVISSLEKYTNCEKSISWNFEEIDDYNKSLWLVSLAILLKVNDDQFNRLLVCIGNEGKDELFEALIATRIKGRKKAKKLIYVKEYHLLLDATKGAHNGINIQQFLLSWYGNMKDCYWHDNHKGKDGGGFFGYWCWEAAAVAVAFNIDDARFRDMKYYPKDMVDFARELANG